MGGLLILGVLLVSTLLWARLDNIYVLVGIGLTLALGAVGFCDDWVKLKRPKADGIKGRTKLAAVTMIGLSVAGLLYLKISGDQSPSYSHCSCPSSRTRSSICQPPWGWAISAWSRWC